MIPPEVLSWLAAPADFSRGVALYAQLGGSEVYQQLFALGETSYSRSVLEREVRALLEVEPNLTVDYLAEQRAQLRDRAFRQQVLNESLVPREPDPVALATVRAQLKRARDERSQLHAQLTAPGLRRADRGRLALRICQLTTRVLGLLADEAHVREHGRLPGPLATAELTDAGELRRRLDNLVALRAKVRRRPERAGELPRLEADIRLIRTKLNLPPRD